ncbi:M48 family metallopeptidase [Streptomyces sp. AK02-04a]|uniref:M48 family metallopeptidase n=1 Tax=Streptomyces sp. AK02-04a TaxID=3028649 RepID=UPI0029A4FA15|nr:M48 family metallopeptidase [Streptomyces sp. AK02-04a]MDX3754034.1 M48 family metallopeptidase [Streptomyces sp. AK02-04a]
MRGTVDEKAQSCPECSTEVRTDPRFTAWCAACGWNVDPGEPEERPGRLEGLRRSLARQHGEALLAEVSADGDPRPRRDAAAVLAYAVALAIHGATIALLGTGVLLVILGWGTALPVVGVILLLLAWLLRPRFGRLPDDAPVLHRAEAPQLFALVDEIASVVGTTGVHAIALTTDVNASVTTYGARRRRLLTIGLGLWEITTPQQRIALLGHELGHYANGDTRQGLVIANALQSLATWRYLMRPISHPTVPEMALNVLYLLPYGAAQGLLMLLDQLTMRAKQRAEYLADAAAARAGSSEAAVALMDRLLVTDSAETLLLRMSNAGQVIRAQDAERREPWRDLWDQLAAHVDSIPEHEYERQRRVGILRGHSVDSTHPPTHLRRACLLARPAVAAAVVADDERQHALDTELAPSRARLARHVLAR